MKNDTHTMVMRALYRLERKVNRLQRLAEARVALREFAKAQAMKKHKGRP